MGILNRLSIICRLLKLSCTIRANHSHDLLRAACLQNEIAPRKFSNRYERWFEKREKGSEKRPTNVKPLNISHPHFSKSFHRPKFVRKEQFFHREALQG